MERRTSRIVTIGAALLLLLSACAGNEPPTSGNGDPSSPEPTSSVEPLPVPEGQSLMDPGSYRAHVEPNAIFTTTTPWYGAANGPGFVVFGQLDHFPYAELYLLNLDEIIERPADPGDPPKVVPAPDDLFTWFVERSGADVVGEPITFEVDGYEVHQADLRITPDTECAPKSTRPWPEACLLIFPIEGDPFAFALGGTTHRIRLYVLTDVDGRTITVIYSDVAKEFPDRVQVADEVIRSITFDA